MKRRTFLALTAGAVAVPNIIWHPAPRRVAVLCHLDGTKTYKYCRNQEEAIEFLQANRASTDVLEIHNV
jgi:hypothetical protein